MAERVDFYSDEEYAQAMNDEQDDEVAYLEEQWAKEESAREQAESSIREDTDA